MKQKAMTLDAALKIIDQFSPVKVIFNNCILYDDYTEEIFDKEEGKIETFYSEPRPPMKVIPLRLYKYEDYVVTSINVEIVHCHHSIVTITGRYDPEVAHRRRENES